MLLADGFAPELIDGLTLPDKLLMMQLYAEGLIGMTAQVKLQQKLDALLISISNLTSKHGQREMPSLYSTHPTLHWLLTGNDTDPEDDAQDRLGAFVQKLIDRQERQSNGDNPAQHPRSGD